MTKSRSGSTTKCSRLGRQLVVVPQAVLSVDPDCRSSPVLFRRVPIDDIVNALSELLIRGPWEVGCRCGREGSRREGRIGGISGGTGEAGRHFRSSVYRRARPRGYEKSRMVSAEAWRPYDLVEIRIPGRIKLFSVCLKAGYRRF